MRVLITGVTGQDGSYLAERLAGQHEVFGMVRGQWSQQQAWIAGLVPGLTLLNGDLLDQTSLIQALQAAQPDVVFNLAGISAPGLSWLQPELAGQVTGLGVLRLLEAVRIVAPGAHVVQASSIAVHGPYGAAKLYAAAVCRDYTERGFRVSQAVLGGHHSPRRSPEFLSRKVTLAVAAAARAVGGDAPEAEPLRLGPLTRSQDWGRATDFVAALEEIGYRDEPGEFVVSTGQPHTSEEFVAAAYAAAGMYWREHVVHDDRYAQPSDVPSLTGQPDQRLAWRPDTDFVGLVRDLVLAEMP